jgi:oligosaccharide repeat unit polymerase
MRTLDEGGINVPSISRLASLCITVIIIYGLIRAILLNAELPLLMPLLAAILSVISLGRPVERRDPVAGLVRVGFHVGLFAYFLSFPILSPEKIDPDIHDDVHLLIGWMLLLTVIGFEAGYFLKRMKRNEEPAGERLLLAERQMKWLWIFICFGMAAWLVTVLDYAYAAGVPVIDVLLTMRGKVEGARENVVTVLGYGAVILSGGLYLAAASAFLLLTSHKRLSLMITASSWLVLAICALIGFLAGSRAVFFYSFVPIVLTSWLRLSRIKMGKTSRWLLVAVAVLVLVVTWGAMTAMRGGDIRNYEGGWEGVNPLNKAHTAFDIYSSMAIIVRSFPEQIDYQYGKSLIPLVLGWVPRPLWAGKPYPFSLYANIVNGETIQDRSASIAVGLSGEGYGNFGLFGVLLWGMLMGIACHTADRFIRRFHPSNPIRYFLAACASIWAAMIVRGGVPEMFYMGLQIMIFPLALSWFLSRRGRLADYDGVDKRIPKVSLGRI